MNTKLTVNRFRIRRPEPAATQVAPGPAKPATPVPPRPAPPRPQMARQAPQPPGSVPDQPPGEPTAPGQASGQGSGHASGQPKARGQTTPRAAPSAAPRAAPQDDDALFATEDDGFGAESFATARGAAQPGAQPAAQPAAGRAAGAGASDTDASAPVEIDAIRREGLTGRQLRMARRLAQKHGLPATSDFDAVRLLRKAGIDPFEKSVMMDLVSPGEGPEQSRALTVQPGADGVRLPQTVKPVQVPSTEARAEQNHVADIMKIQRDLMRRRRRRSMLLAVRLLLFVGLPTLFTAWYFYLVATPLYATKSEFVIQQAEAPSAAGLGGLLRGSALATSQDSIAVQGYLQSRDAMLRLDEDAGFRAHFQADTVDTIQRLSPDAGIEDAYKIFKRNVKISYDPTEGIIKMEVIAADPDMSVAFANKLIGYAEERVDHLTQRLREDQMAGAREAYESAEKNMLEAQRRVVDLQEKFKILSSEVEVTLITSQISGLESQLTADRLSLAQMEANQNPNAARMEPLKRRIATLESEIALLRGKLTEAGEGGTSLAQVQSELLVAEADVQTRQLLLAQSLQSMETARLEANRQVRYLSVSVSPVAPDRPTYPRAFENTSVALLIFAGIYLMISMTVAILREQVTA